MAGVAMTPVPGGPESLYPDWMQPMPLATGPPRISGTAMPGGVFMSTGTARTASDLALIATGLSLAALGGCAMVLTYIVSWLIEQISALPLTGMLLLVTSAFDTPAGPWVEIGLNLLSLLSFLVLMRISPLSAYHAAEHKVIGAIEHFGEPTMENARMMPRAHIRCGSNLLAGVLPLLLIAGPLWRVSEIAAVAVVVLGWSLRFHTGYLIQAIFATKEPTDRQLRAGLEAGHRILRLWREHLSRPVPPLVSIWRRGLIQMFAGMMLGLWLLSQAYQHLHVWLDF
ncbi:MAG: DUF1385 domain-containing protein [Armatimonadota bacterium]